MDKYQEEQFDENMYGKIAESSTKFLVCVTKQYVTSLKNLE